MNTLRNIWIALFRRPQRRVSFTATLRREPNRWRKEPLTPEEIRAEIERALSDFMRGFEDGM